MGQFVNSSSVNGATVTLPTGIQAGDYIILFAYRATTTAPSLPSGYTNISNQSANSNSFRVQYKVAAGTESGTTVTCTNAILVIAAVYRGVVGIGGAGSTTTASGTTTNMSGIATMSVTDGTSWAVAYGGSAQTTSMSTPSGTTLRKSQAGTGGMGILVDSAGGVSSWALHTSTNGAAAVNGGGSFELKMSHSPTVALNSPADTGTVSTATPQLQFTGTDAEADAITYEVQIDTVTTFDSSGAQVLASYSETNRDSVFLLDTTDFAGAGETFTGNGSTLDSAKFYLSKTGSPTGNATVNVYATTGIFGSTAKPTGSPLATASATLDVSTLTTSYALYTFNFAGANRISLSNSTTYAVTIEYPGGNGSNTVNVGMDNSSSSASSNNVLLSGGTWSTTSSGLQDVVFYVYSASPLLDKLSASDSGFTDITNGAHTDPFTSGEQIGYTTPSLSDGTYYWHVRGKDPSGSNTYGAWSSTRSFTVSTGGGGGPSNAGQFFAFF